MDEFMQFFDRQGSEATVAFELDATKPAPREVQMFETGRDPYMAFLVSLEIAENGATGFASWQEPEKEVRSGGCAVMWKGLS